MIEIQDKKKTLDIQIKPENLSVMLEKNPTELGGKHSWYV